MDDRQYLRRAEVVIGPKVKVTNGPVEPPDALRFGSYIDSKTGILQQGIRIKFSIEKGDSSNANKCTISLFNLSVDSKSFLEKENLVVFLSVGYGDSMRNIFFGDVTRFNEKRDGADIVSILECGDSETALRESNIQIGLAPGATNLQVIDEAISRLRLPVSYKSNIKKITFNQGFSFSGQVKRLLDQLITQAGLTWSIQDGELLIAAKKETDQVNAVLISPETGLLGIPTKTKDGIEFECLINPAIRPGRAVRVESKKFLSGVGVTMKVVKATYDGDTHDGDYKLKVEGVNVNGK